MTSDNSSRIALGRSQFFKSGQLNLQSCNMSETDGSLISVLPLPDNVGVDVTAITTISLQVNALSFPDELGVGCYYSA